MTQQRAQEIYAAARAKAKIGPWSDQLDKVMTPEERGEIRRVWHEMPGYTCFVDALMRIMRGEA